MRITFYMNFLRTVNEQKTVKKSCFCFAPLEQGYFMKDEGYFENIWPSWGLESHAAGLQILGAHMF